MSGAAFAHNHWRKMKPEEILGLPMRPNDSGAVTIRGYLIALLRELWIKEEGFGGKRPFGNSGWQHDLYTPLVVAGVIPGRVDEDGWLLDCDYKQGHEIILEAIEYGLRE